MRIAFIYRGEFTKRSANRLSMVKNVAAARRLGHEVVLYIPRDGLPAAESRAAIEKALAEYAGGEQFPVVRVPRPTLGGKLRRTFDLLAAARARAGSFDLVWSREFHAADYAAALGLRAVLEHHHFPFSPRQSAILRRALGRKGFRGVAAISGAQRRMMIEAGFPADRVVTVHSGVDLAQFEAARASQNGLRSGLAAPGEPLVVYAGSLYPGKGGEMILPVAERLRGVRFLCIGGRDFEVAEMRERVEARGLTNVTLSGHMPHPQVVAHLLAADVLIAPFTEGGQDISGKVIMPFASPIKLFEYMAAGRPLVTSDVGAIPEVIRDGENGLLVKPGNVEGLVSAVTRLMGDRELSDRLAAAAHEDVKAYTWERRVERVLDFAFGG
ncbi:MAG TPA: glycosyltransferase family 4 protein [Pyrinomonadaceae bacterium]|nr:glycosyltransferase family 4 protein [Pyrinomonadaceae bacterium]